MFTRPSPVAHAQSAHADRPLERALPRFARAPVSVVTGLRDQLQQSLGPAYTIERELGGGGMSRVFLAEETRFKRRVVIKVLSPELAAGISVQRFEREITLVAQLQQANIVSVITAGDSDGLPYFTMPYVEGESLRARLGAGPLSMADTISVLRDVARALAYAHDRGIVHRDIKPDNVLLSGAAAVVTDFGIAKALADAAIGSSSPNATNLTQMGTSIGTPAYMAPEQAAGDPDVDHRVDVYALGCMAYELLTGNAPFHGRTPQRVLAAHMNESPRPVVELRADTPPALAELVMRMLAKSPEDRPQSAKDVLAALDASGAVSSTQATSLTLGAPGMLLRALVLYVVAFVVVAIGARLAVVAIGLPDWVFPGALIVMALGLPVVLFTGYAHHVSRRIATRTPTLTPGGHTASAMPAGTLATIAVNASPHLSWRRTSKGGVIALGAFAILVTAFMVLRALGIGPFGSLLAAGRLRNREPLLVADFKVLNSDSSLGSVISQAVRSNLEQSDAITLVPQASVTLGLQRMQRAGSSKLDLTLARELAAREGYKAIVDGEIAGVGSGYLVTLRLITADSGRELASFREGADGVKDLINAVDVVTRKLRGRIGESLREVRASPPLAEVTTASLDALRKYTESVHANLRLDYAGSVRLAREAIVLDTGFALAYRQLGEALANSGARGAESDSAVSRAFRMRERLTETERLTVEAQYYSQVLGDRPRAIAAYEALLARGVYRETNSLARLYINRREFDRADSLYRLRIRVDPGSSMAYSNFAVALAVRGKLAEAESVVTVAERLFPDVGAYALRRWSIIYRRDGPGQALRYGDTVRRALSPQERSWILANASTVYLLAGKLREHERAAQQASAMDSTRGAPHDPATDSLFAIRRDRWLLPPSPRIAQRVDAVAALAHQPRSSPAIAMVYALVGRADLAHAMLARYDGEMRDTVRRRIDAPRLAEARGAIALAERRTADAAMEFRASDRLPDGPATNCGTCLYALLAQAYDAADNADSTIANIEHYITATSYRNIDDDAIYLAPFLKRLGELYEAKGRVAEAASAYQRFVTQWKDADPELQPKVREVKQRLARLRVSEGARLR